MQRPSKLWRQGNHDRWPFVIHRDRRRLPLDLGALGEPVRPAIGQALADHASKHALSPLLIVHARLITGLHTTSTF